MRHAPHRPPFLPLLPTDIDAMMHVPERRLQKQKRDDHGAQDGMPVAGVPGAGGSGHPGAEAEAGEREGEGEELRGRVVEDCVGGAGEAEEEDAEGEEEDEGERHEGGVGDDDVVVVGWGLFGFLLGGGEVDWGLGRHFS